MSLFRLVAQSGRRALSTALPTTATLSLRCASTLTSVPLSAMPLSSGVSALTMQRRFATIDASSSSSSSAAESELSNAAKKKTMVDKNFLECIKLVQAEKLGQAKQQLEAVIAAYRQLGLTEGVVRGLNTQSLIYAKEGAFAQTVKYLLEALTLARQMPSADELVGKLTQQLAVAYSKLNEIGAAIKAAEEALAMAQRRKDTESEASMRLTLGSLCSPQRDAAHGHYSTTIRHLNAAVKLYEALGNVESQISAQVLVAREHAHARNLDLSNRAWDQTLQLCEPLPARVEEWEAYYGLGTNYTQMGPEHAKFALDSFREAHSIAEALQNEQLQLVSAQTLCYALFSNGELDDAISIATSLLKIAQMMNNAEGQVQGHLNLGRFNEETNPDVAEDHYRQARDIAAKSNSRAGEARSLSALADVKERRGDSAMAISLYQQALKQAQLANERLLKAEILHRLGALHIAGNASGAAIEALTQAASLFESMNNDTQTLSVLSQLATALRANGDALQADAMIARAMALAAAMHERGMIPDLPKHLQEILKESKSDKNASKEDEEDEEDDDDDEGLKATTIANAMMGDNETTSVKKPTTRTRKAAAAKPATPTTKATKVKVTKEKVPKTASKATKK